MARQGKTRQGEGRMCGQMWRDVCSDVCRVCGSKKGRGGREIERPRKEGREVEKEGKRVEIRKESRRKGKWQGGKERYKED